MYTKNMLLSKNFIQKKNVLYVGLIFSLNLRLALVKIFLRYYFSKLYYNDTQ
jgi:hypothetical protein